MRYFFDFIDWSTEIKRSTHLYRFVRFSMVRNYIKHFYMENNLLHGNINFIGSFSFLNSNRNCSQVFSTFEFAIVIQLHIIVVMWNIYISLFTKKKKLNVLVLILFFLCKRFKRAEFDENRIANISIHDYRTSLGSINYR